MEGLKNQHETDVNLGKNKPETKLVALVLVARVLS